MTTHPNSAWFRRAPLVIAHRGASSDAPENTLAAFRLAAQQRADAVELDAKLSADGRVMVHHDLTLDRTTTGRGLIARRTFEELKRLDAGVHYSTQYAGEAIPELTEVLELLLPLSMLINIEMTNYAQPWDDLPHRVVEHVCRYEAQGLVLLSSFNVLALRTARRLAPELPLGLLLRPEARRLIQRATMWFTPHDALHPHESGVNSTTPVRAHALGKRVFVWTVNNVSRMRELIQWGIDGLITDHPEQAVKLLSEGNFGSASAQGHASAGEGGAHP